MTLGQIKLIDLPGAVQPGMAAQLLEKKDVGFADQDRSDTAMLQEATQNRQLAESFVAARGLLGGWNLAEIILRAYVPVVNWPGSDQPRSSMGIPILAENFYSTLSSFQQALFAGSRPFIIDPTASTTQDVAHAQEVLIMAQLKTAGPKGTSAKQELRAIAYDGFLYGTGVGIVGWETRKVRRKMYRRKGTPQTVAMEGGSTVQTDANEDDVEEYFDEYEVNHPFLEHVPIRRVRVAPDCRKGNIRTAAWAGRIFYATSYDLDQLRDVEGFNIPTREQLIALTTPQKLDSTNQNQLESQSGTSASSPLSSSPTSPAKAQPEYMSAANTVDPLMRKWEIFEYWTGDRQVWILENQYTILNRVHDFGGIPMVSFNFREAPDSFFGYGMALFCTDFQRMAQGVANSFFDDLALRLMGTYTSPRGINNLGQNAYIFPGKIFKTDGPEGMQPMKRDTIGNDPLLIVDQLKAMAASVTGAGIATQGANPGAPGNMRTGAGVNALLGGESTKMQDLVDQFCDLVLIPVLEFMVEQNRRLKPSQLRQLLNATLTEAFKGDVLNVLNGSYKVTIDAGAKMAARAALAQGLGYIQAILSQPGLTDQLAIQATKIDYAALIKALFTSSGYPYQDQIIVPMTDDDKQRLAQQQQAGKLQNDLAKINAQADAKIRVNENQAESRALLRTQEHAFQQVDQGAMNGRPS